MDSKHQLTSWVPHSYQEDGVKLMISQACAGLLYKPGRGKTSVVYMAFRILQELKYVDKLLVICPLRPMYVVWPSQKDRFHEFKHLKVNILHGKDKEEKLQDPTADIYVINPEGLGWLLGATSVGGKLVFNPNRANFIKSRFPMLVVDESTKFRNPQTQRFKLLRQFIKFFKRRYILTGTPTPKGLMDLFGQIYILDEGSSLGRFITHYRTQFFYPGGYGGYEWFPQPDARERIIDKISPLVQVVERSSSDPTLLYDDIFIKLDEQSRKKYDDMEEKMMLEIESGNVVAANAAVASGKCRQICNGAFYTSPGEWEPVHELKIDALEDLIEQLQGDPLLVTYEFDFDRERLAKRLKIPCISTGNIKHDTALIKKFANGELPVVMGQPQSISLGTDGLQDSCSNIAMFGVTWNFLDYEQVIDRVRRQGNTAATVAVHRILVEDSVDERVIDVIDGRDKSQAAFMRALKRD